MRRKTKFKMIKAEKVAKLLFLTGLSVLLATSSCFPLLGYAQETENDTALDTEIHVPGGAKLVTVEAENKNVREILRGLSKQAGFNMVLDDSVNGNVTLALSRVSTDHALRTIADLASLEIIPQEGNIFLVMSKQAAADKGLSRQLTKVLRVKYGNAGRVATLLNNSLFATSNGGITAPSGGPGGSSPIAGGASGSQKIRADLRTNSLVILGTQREIQLAEAALPKLDQPRESKTFFLSHANALDVSTQLASSIFNDGNNVFQLSAGGSGAAANNPSGVQSSPLRIEQENIQEGSGINNLTSTGSSGGSSGGGSSGPFSQNIVLRGMVKSSQVANISPDGPMVVPDTRLNTVTVFGTAEQVAAAEKLIPVLDAQLPEVSIEASLVELTEEGAKQLGTDFGYSYRKWNFGFNNKQLPNSSSVIGLPTLDPQDNQQFAFSGGGFTTNPLTMTKDLALQINALVSTKRAKIVANPSIVATHDTEAVISIVDEIIRRVLVQVDNISGTTQIQTELGEAGIILDILPKIGEDGTINLRIRPSVSSVKDVERDSNNNIVTLLSRRDLLAQQVRMVDGQTLVLGGLISQNDMTRQDKLPILGDLPIIGAMSRANTGSNKRSELLILITPHILNKAKITPVTATNPLKNLLDRTAGQPREN